MSIKVDIISGFLGAGKTTLIKQLFKAGFSGEKVVLIENEFGEIGIDGTFLKEAGIDIKETILDVFVVRLSVIFQNQWKK